MDQDLMGRETRMDVAVSEAKGQLTDLVRRAEAGEDVVLTRHGQPVVRLAAIKPVPSEAERRALLASVRGMATSGVDAARSQDFLFGDDGLPC